MKNSELFLRNLTLKCPARPCENFCEFEMSSARPDPPTPATRSTKANNNMNSTLLESDSDSDKPKWRNLLTRTKHQLNVSNRNLITRIQFAREVKTSSNRDKLESAIKETNDHNDFLAAATEMFEGVWHYGSMRMIKLR